MLTMPDSSSNLTLRLLPLPKELQAATGVCRLRPDTPLEVRCDDPRVDRAAERWRASLDPPKAEKPAALCTLRIAVDRTQIPHRNGYRLNIRSDGIELVGGSSAGCFYGLQTLAQLSNTEHAEVPCCTIVDWPDFDTRGVLHDVTRGKVPTLDTLKLLVDRLAQLKVNQLQLYIEHAFVFSFDPEICEPHEGLTPDEVRELDDYCRERFIDLVPALATFGHMGRILSMPKYRHLAEVESTKSWCEMTWPERMRGLTLDCRNPEAHQLVERMWSDVLDAFSAPIVNICGDEPWDLGQGKNRERFVRCGKGEPYVEHIRRIHDICSARGRRTQVWSDVVRDYPDLLDRLPRDLTLLHWGYDDQADYDGTGTFVEAGLDTFVCPGTQGWKRIINAVDLAERNIAAFATAGHNHGARGLINADWGDHGHFNSLACSWHGIALGAALAWNADHPTAEAFDERFARVMLGVDDPAGVRLLRKASRVADRCETWRLLWIPLCAVCKDPSLPTRDEAAEAGYSAHEFQCWCERFRGSDSPDPHDLAELSLACRFTELFTEKIAFAHRATSPPTESQFVDEERHAWGEKLMEAARAYAECWRARNKPSGLDDILRALTHASDDVRTVKR